MEVVSRVEAAVTPRLLRSQLLSQAGFAHAFPMRDASDAELAEALGVDAIVQVKQVHGARAVEASQASGEEGDAIVARAGAGPVAVGVRTADCVPVLVACVRSGDVAAIHAGWRGVVAGVVRAGVESLRASEAPRLAAAIGPCIGACCFEVGRDVATRIAEACGDAGVVDREAGEKAYVDLRRAVRAQLRALGVEDALIDDVPGCTRCDAASFHSYRRDGASSGRMLSAIATRARTGRLRPMRRLRAARRRAA
jgi:YfiH family protein